MGPSGCGKTTLISCIVGVRGLDSGQIKTFDESSKNSQHSRIGFMPQETALVGNFKIKEMLWFFGTIFGLSADEIKDKTKFLSDLLDLPDNERLVKNCSGGTQRRISFAVALIHDPELLILDEPTVGVDVLLRERIWNYLVQLTRTKNVTILLSTHCIEEAKQSNTIGLMRNGFFIAEDAPQNILQMSETRSLEEAFFKLCQKQEVCSIVLKPIEHKTHSEPSSSKFNPHFTPAPNQRKRKIMKALLTKHYLELVRNIG